MKKLGTFRIGARGLCVSAVAVLLMAGSAVAQEAPAPRKMPRVPVHRQPLETSDKQAPVLKTREVTGQVTIIDGEHLRINDIDLRLFGVVPPQLSASYGPQARAALDELTRGQAVTCHVRDRDHDGRFLATCVTVAKVDLALELVKRGLAVTARGSIQPTELAVPYESAEDAAQKQKLGLWAVAVPPQAAMAPPTIAKNDNPNVPPLPSELKKEEKPVVAVEKPASPTVVVSPPTPQIVKESAVTAPAVAVAAVEDNSGMSVFFERYQLLITGLVMLATALGIMIVLAAERRRDRREETRAIAAALRGELLAARAVCQARLKTWTDADEKTAPWPRIRATLYQAYVGKVGWLGAVLARQVASIYGQASDYAAYFNPNSNAADPRGETASRRKALQALVQHIEEVLPKLAVIEQTGRRPKGGQIVAPSFSAPAQTFTPSPETAAQPVPTAQDSSAHYDVSHLENPAPTTTPVWNIIQRYKNARGPQQADDPLPDYTALLEEEMARMSSEEESAPPSSNVTKIRGTGV